MTSPCLSSRGPRGSGPLILSLRNFTEPSSIRTLAPPEWKLLRLNMPAFSMPLALVLQLGYFAFGGSRSLPRV